MLSYFPPFTLFMKINLRLLFVSLVSMAGSVLPVSNTTDMESKKVFFPTDYFSPPLNTPMMLSGTFAELRPNHFHAGIDIKTDNRENLPVYACAEGYVSRVLVSTTGYGNAIYINHPNGFTTLYAHLNTFEGEIGKWVKRKQYALQKFSIDEKLAPNELPVTRGMNIAKSGNTGSSESPHLHFEVRDTQTEEALNPLKFGFKVQDNIRPTIAGVYIYNLENFDRYYKQSGYWLKNLGNGNYAPATKNGTVNIISSTNARVGVGIKTYDFANGASNKNGVYSLVCYDNGVPIYGYEMVKVGFDETRYINSHIDYDAKSDGEGYIQKCFLDPANQLRIYNYNQNNGIIDLSDQQLHKITIETKDFYGNVAKVNCMLQYKPTTTISSSSNDAYAALFLYDNENTYNSSGVDIRMPVGTLYKNIYFKYSLKNPQSAGIYSNVHSIHDDNTPVHAYYDLAIQPTNLPPNLTNKTLIAYMANGVQRTLKGSYDGNYVRGRARSFGKFYVMADTIAPKIVPINITQGRNMQAQKGIRLNIVDNLSGIDAYNGYIDGRWVLFEYEEKSGKLEYIFDEHTPPGNHHLSVEVSDNCENTRHFDIDFIR